MGAGMRPCNNSVCKLILVYVGAWFLIVICKPLAPLGIFFFGLKMSLLP